MRARTFSIKISEDAESDLDNAYIWYEIQKQKLGIDFIKRVDEGIRKIRTSPQRYHFIYKNIRRYLIKRFPFSIYYYIDEPVNEIKIIAVFHNSRNPQIWKKRN